MNPKILTSVSLVLACLLLQGCFTKLDVTPDEVVAEINSVLQPGDSAEKIDEYLTLKGMEASYDKYASRYQSIIRHPDSNFHAITIYIYVDENKLFERVEANDSYTFL